MNENKEYYRKWRDKNKERIKELERIRYWKNPERFREKNRIWKNNNKEKYSKSLKKSRENHKNKGLCINCGNEKGISPSTIYCEKCHYNLKEKNKINRSKREKYYRKNGVCIKCGNSLNESRSKRLCIKCYDVFLRCQKRRFILKDKIIKEQNRIVRYSIRKKALQIVSGMEIPKCCICGETDIRILTINHKNGRFDEDKRYGKQRFPKTIYSKIVFGKYKEKIKDLDVRCYNHNILYEYEGRNRLIFPKEKIEEYMKMRWS